MKHESILEGVALEPWRQHLLDAAAYIEEHGFCKNAYSTADGVCLVGALMAIKADDNAFRSVRDFTNIRYGEGPECWNDRPETTKDMAVAALIGAALQ